MFRYLISLILISVAGTATAGTTEYKLDNGMKILVREDHRSPVVVSQIWYKVGSSYEHNGATGLSHVLEHLMFKGTKKYGPNEFSRIIAENGGRENAFTGQDYTAYFQQLEKSRLPIALELEADRMRNLVFDPEETRKEIQVVMEERRMRTEDKPISLTYERFLATAYVNSPYHHPIIGWMQDLEAMQVEDLQAWYDYWYAPNNATLVVVGDVDPEQVLALAKQHFGPIPARKQPQIKPQREVEHLGLRRIAVQAPAQLPHLIMGYKVPSVSTAKEDWEPYALEVLAYVLDGGNSARFSSNLIRGEEIASGLSAGYDPYGRLDELFTINGTPAQGHSVSLLESAIRNELEKVQKEPVSKEELERVKAQVMAAKVYEKDSIFYQAMQMGQLETVGLDWKLMDEYVNRIRKVTPEQVMKVARKYFSDDRLTVAELKPQPLDRNPPVKRSAGGRHAR